MTLVDESNQPYSSNHLGMKLIEGHLPDRVMIKIEISHFTGNIEASPSSNSSNSLYQ